MYYTNVAKRNPCNANSLNALLSIVDCYQTNLTDYDPKSVRRSSGATSPEASKLSESRRGPQEPLSMALTAGNVDGQTRTLPSAWTPLDPAHTMQAALEALETYKKKDPSKGTSPSSLPVDSTSIWLIGICPCHIVSTPHLP